MSAPTFVQTTITGDDVHTHPSTIDEATQGPSAKDITDALLWEMAAEDSGFEQLTLDLGPQYVATVEDDES